MANDAIPADLVREFLSVLERHEARLLGWGVVDGAFSQDELDELAETFLAACPGMHDPETLVDRLVEEHLLCELNVHGRRIYRTRMAESIRLLARLRQLFPNKDWRVAPTLVADYRFAMRPRRYPARNIAPATTMERVARGVPLSAVQRSALHALLDSPTRRLQLAEFQVRATVQVLRDLAGHQSRGVIVCAGTGTGKTLAFYLPALTQIAGLVKQNSHWTKAVAIYPRNELLKDQFSEAYREARCLDSLLATVRKLTIGAFFGPTPWRATVEAVQEAGWESEGAGFACPYLRCPGCEGTLVWTRADVAQKCERLRCTAPNCGRTIEPDEVILSRERLARTPPDLVFTTTETLNRQLSSASYGHVFGVNVPAATRPRLVLLDEVHTYHGVHGAQVAHVLRRWRYAVGAQVQFTGLSATLRDAREFFSRLTGLHAAMVEEISPTGDLIEEGMEYLLALRGDPVSGTSLLSTTIQTAMLLRRMLDPNGPAPSSGPAGRRVYVFTDDLDVTNRLFHNLLDAEGRDGFGVPLAGRAPLAAIRGDAPAEDSAERLAAGQYWRASEAIGHRLSQPLAVARTSSQDTGVARDADIIVATASLEVGYNDPEVGAVLQHKAPRDMASFLQRKGRAGRRRTMRPWTVVVLSDYGRDRLAYQGYDLLFDPVLEPRTLPISNRYVLRIQAVYAFMDWVAHRRPKAHRAGSVWIDFARPAGGGADEQARQRWQAELIRQVLNGEEAARDLESHLAKALRLAADEVLSVLWEPPRALMTAVLPTLLRRLESGWTRVPVRAGESEADHLESNSPLPDFVPENLFSDLNLPEVVILTPRSARHADTLDEATLPIVQGMKALAPGNVTRRFAPYRSHVSHWIAPPSLDDPDQVFPVETLCAQYQELGQFEVVRDDALGSLRCIRPWVLRAGVVPFHVLPTSRGSFTWQTQIYPTADGVAFEPPLRSPWRSLVTEVRFYTHNQHAHAVGRRFALEAQAEVRFRNGEERRLRMRFVDGPTAEPVAVGFVKAVDAIAFRCHLPADLGVGPDASNRAKQRGLRTAYFRHRVASDERLAGFTNAFQREWLGQIYLSALTAHALAEQVTLQVANAALSANDLARVLDVIFQTLAVDESAVGTMDGAPSDPSAADQHQRVHAALLDLCARGEVRAALADLASVLWDAPDAAWRAWAEDRVMSTLGGALLEACQRLCPQFDASDLLVDIDPGPRPADAPARPDDIREIWITEEALGGAGVVEEILRRYADDPALFFRLADAALEPSDFEVVDSELTTFLRLAAEDAELQRILASARAASSQRELARSIEALREGLGARGMIASHAVMSALQTRVLRPGSSAATDALLHRLIGAWRADEERLGVEIDARVFAYVASASANFGDALSHVGATYHQDARWRFHVIYSLLWPRGYAVRARALASYNPFVDLPATDRELLADCLANAITEVSVEDKDWLQQVTTSLARDGTVRLVAPPQRRTELRTAVLQLAAQPLEIGFLQLHPQVDGIRRRADVFTVTLRLREAIQ